ncbi:type II secretion system protein [Paludisphaera borealis]|uniref:Type II secretion system protein J n=1 Tax=Paludisphaera borealis TaxID=1387353 RepID=A0A1U7CW29_9BACT|nr:hypothetical protein [Paludisphaera borealis]APW63160.1 hypothetical protein BSF38_04721 [Paludisphaera borealis]
MIRANQRVLGRRRRGITIIETLVMMTGVAVLLGMTVIVLQLAMKLEADSRGRLDRAGALGRLARQFRSDVHAASGVEIVTTDPKRQPGLRIAPGPNRSIDYQPQGDGKLARVDTVGGKVASRETFIVPQSGAVRLSLRELDGRRFAVVEVDTIARKNRIDPVRTLEILGAVGKDVRSLASEAKTEGGKP